MCVDLNIALAQYVVGDIQTDDLPSIATHALVAGYTSISLAALAGAERATTPAELRELLDEALSELGLCLPDLVTAAVLLKRSYARRVVSAQLAPRDGAARIVELYYAVSHLLPDRAYAADGFDIVALFGAHHSYDDESASDSAVRADLDATILGECRRIAAEEDVCVCRLPRR